jgi:membrane-bound metal-dependent hydrolase YbcI (DUF457 family)
VCAAAGPLLDLHPSPLQIGAGAVVAAGAALIPDVDHPSSTVARALGPLTRIAARVISWVSDAVRDGTCGCCATEGTRGHRTLTHTAAFAVAAGGGVCAAGWRWGLPAAAIVVGVAAGLAVLGLLPRARRFPRARRGNRAGRWLVGVMAGAACWWTLTALGDPGAGWWWVGVPAGVGLLAHALGDGLTRAGVPLWWPLRIRGCRWYPAGLPRWLRFRTGGPAETLVSVLLVVGGVAAGWVLVAG